MSKRESAGVYRLLFVLVVLVLGAVLWHFHVRSSEERRRVNDALDRHHREQQEWETRQSR